MRVRRSAMRRFWDRRADENPWFFINNTLSYREPDLERFWASGESDLDVLLEQVGVELAPSDRLVEIGCGAGRMTRAIARRVTAVTAVDVSPRMIEIARAENPGLDNVEWMVGDGATLAGVGDASADGCISYVVLQHIPDREVIYGYVREMGRVLRADGWAIFQVSDSPKPHRAGFQGPRRRLASLRGRMPKGLRSREWLGARVDLDELRAAAREGGLELERIEGEGTQFCIVRARRLANNAG